MAFDTPIASYDDTTTLLNRRVQLGQRGYAGVKAALTTALTGANNDLVITAKDSRPGDSAPIKVQYAVLGNNAPVGLYEGGTPAKLVPPTNLGFELITTVPGTLGNQISLTLVNPGRGQVRPLEIEVPVLNSIVVQLAHNATVVTTTAPLLVAALKANPVVSQMVLPYISDSSITDPLTALAKTYFKGGSDVPGLVLVSLANTDGSISATGTAVKALLNGSQLVSAANAGGNSGAGAVTAMGATALTGGTSPRGSVLDDTDQRRDLSRLTLRPGQPVGKETNATLQVRSGRSAQLRNGVPTPAEDKNILASSNINYQRERGGTASSWF